MYNIPMVKMKSIVFLLLAVFFLLFSFYPTIFELQRQNNLADKNREFILEHNYYWPDYNLYLSKIRQGIEGRLTTVEKYTSEKHQGSLIQEFYLGLGWLGKIFNLDPNSSYLLGRIILAPLLLLVIWKLSNFYFPLSIFSLLSFLIIIVSGSFPRFYSDSSGILQIGRYMEWWSNIDALQRIAFIPHILFGQIASFYLLYKLSMKQWNNATIKQLVFYIFLGNLVGLTFPPSLITLNTALILSLILKRVTRGRDSQKAFHRRVSERLGDLWSRKTEFASALKRYFGIPERQDPLILIFIIFTLPSLLYIYFITKIPPWSALVEFHKTHPMMIPFDQYILGTGPIFFLGIFGAVLSIIKRDKKFQPLIFWVLATFSFAAFFSFIRGQSPLRFTQTGLFIPLGLLGTYFFYQLFHLSDLSHLGNLEKSQLKAILIIILSLYILGSLLMMKTSLDWQTTWITQRLGANVPPVPYPPQAMYPLKSWMDGIRWLKNNTGRSEVVLAEITTGNYIPAYSGNFVYWGQSNTFDYIRKELEVDKFFKEEMPEREALLFLKNGRIKYIFFSIQEKEKAGGKSLESIYPFLKSVYFTSLVTIYSYNPY